MTGRGTARPSRRFIATMKHLISAAALALCLAACSSKPSPSASAATASAVPEESIATSADTASGDEGAIAAAQPMVMPVGNTPMLTLEGLDDLEIGKPVPRDGSWAERGAQISDACRTVSSPEFPGVYAIVEDGKVRRITVGQRSDVTLVEGIGVGAGEAEVKQAFPGFRASPHAYEDAPAKYLTAPNAGSGEAALRFEIGQDGKVSLIHVGTMPVLGYVEGCA